MMQEGNEDESRKRQKGWRKRSQSQPERYRCGRSKAILKSLAKAKSNKNNVEVLSVNYSSNSTDVILNHNYIVSENITVTISQLTRCTCSIFTRLTNKNSETCMHITWVLMYACDIPEESMLLQQVIFSNEEGLKNIDFCENYIFFKVTLFLIEIYRRVRI